MLRRFIGGKRRSAVVVTALTALAIGVSVGVAKSGPSQLKVQIQYHNENCGVLTTKKFIGTADVIAEKGVLTVRGHVHGADPGHYILELWRLVPAPLDCAKVTGLDEFKVDGSGDGNFAGSAAVSGQTFFITLNNTGSYNDSPIFKIGGLS
jgi:hypothetical protein